MPQGFYVFNSQIKKTILGMALSCAAAFSIWALAILPLTARVATQDHPNAVKESEETGTTWRYTRNGWQDIGGMYRDSFVAIKSFELVHPLIWAASVLLAVMGTSIWASNEWEIARLLDRNSDSSETAKSSNTE